MWRVLAIAVALTGCSSLFGLEPPIHDDSIPSDGGRSDSSGTGDGLPSDASMPTDATSINGCPATYSATFGLSTSRYRIVTNSETWDTAQAACVLDQISGSQKYTHLFVAVSDTELTALEAAVSSDVWVGLSDRAIEGGYQWVTQETNNYPPTTGDPWGAGEPKASANEDCVLMDGSGDLNVRDCGTNKPFVCECDGFMNDPTRY